VKSVVCWCTWRFVPLDVHDTATAARKKKGRPSRRKAAANPRRLEPVPG